MLFVSTSVTNDCLNSSTNNTTIDVKLIFFIVDSLVIVANSQIQLIKPESDGEVKKTLIIALQCLAGNFCHLHALFQHFHYL